MKKIFVILVCMILCALPVSAQRKVLFSAEKVVGVGFAKGPKVFSTTEFVAEYPLGSFAVGAGVGIRVALPTGTYTKGLDGSFDRSSILEYDLPLFLRMGYEGEQWNALVDMGYALGLLAVVSAPGVPPSGVKDTCYNGFFVEPHLGLSVGKHSLLSVGVLFQKGECMYKELYLTDDILSETAELQSTFTPAITLRYTFRF